jgi:hypothetical protein
VPKLAKYTLDARPDRIDLRDREYLPPLRSLAATCPDDALIDRYLGAYTDAGLVLDQGPQGACTGFGLACVINYLSFVRALGGERQAPVTRVSPRMLYHLARYYDEWPGEDYEGSSCRGALKAWHKHGVCAETLWPYGPTFVPPSAGWDQDAASRPLGVYYRIDKRAIADLQAAIQEVGAIYCSADVHKGWMLDATPAPHMSHETLPVIRRQSRWRVDGGHAFALVGYNARGFVVQNSWGESWGARGFAVLTYEDWVKHGTDAWAAVMGAPMAGRPAPSHVVRSSTEKPSAAALARRMLWSGDRGGGGHAARRANAAAPIWDDGTAYRHTIVMTNNGRIVPKLITYADAGAAARAIASDLPLAWFRSAKAPAPRIAVYAHGGLNDEDASVNRIRVLAPFFEANGVYPLFLTWKTGVLESVSGIIEDAVQNLFPESKGIGDVLRKASGYAADASDRMLEVACERLGVKAIWSQMKQNAAAAAQRDAEDPRGLTVLVEALAALRAAQPATEIHLIGHSAGSILLGHLLDLARGAGLRIDSCHLYAAACTVDFANRHYAPAVAAGTLAKRTLHLHLLSDARELDDTVGPYRKSLLYLVSRGLEDYHKTPLLGMDRAFESLSAARREQWSPATHQAIRDWQRFWGDSVNYYRIDGERVVTSARYDDNGKLREELTKDKATHGSFDNNVRVIAQTLARITGRANLTVPVTDLRY